MHGGDVVAVFLELGFEPMNIVDGVIHCDAHGDGGHGDGHHIQGDAHPAHQAEYGACCDQVGGDADQGQLQRAEQDQEHCHDGGEDHADGFDLGIKQALQHVVVHHGHAGKEHLVFRVAQFRGQVFVDAVQQLLSTQFRHGLQDPDAESRLVVLLGDVGRQQGVLQVVRHGRRYKRQLQGVQRLALVDSGEDLQGGVDGQYLAGFG